MQSYTITSEGSTYERPDPDGRWYRKEDVQKGIADYAQATVKAILADLGFVVEDAGNGEVVIQHSEEGVANGTK